MNQHAAFTAIVATLPVGGMGIFSIGMFSLYRANSRTNLNRRRGCNYVK
ncbi:MAG: hypothetical protein ABL858_03735 [Candidatus Nitrotoga sp.]